MSQPNDSQRDELRDRLLEQALRETLGDESPPDLSDRILAAADEQTSELPQPVGDGVMEKSNSRRFTYVGGAVAVCLLIGTTIVLLLPSVQANREAARRAESSNSRQQQDLAGAADQLQRERASRNYLLLRDMDMTPLPEEPPILYPTTEHWNELTRRHGSTGPAGVPGASGPVALDSSGPVPMLNKSPYLPSSKPGTPSTSAPVFIPLDPKATETKPGRFSFSAGVNSDAGLIGSVVVDEDKPHAGRPGHVAQQNIPRDLALTPDGRIVASGGAEPAQTLPSPWYMKDGYMKDGVQYFPSSNSSNLKQEAERLGRPDERFQLFGRIVDEDGSGQGPGQGGDQYVRLVENPFRAVKDHPLSTFSIDVDTASYANVRRFLLQENQLPPPDAVRIEELVNYFDYDYSGPTGDVPFASHIEIAGCPWAPEHRLVRIALKGHEIDTNQRPKSNLVFLLDVSGSMSSADKLPLLQQGMKLLAGQLTKNDRVAIVVYAGSEGLVLPSTPGDQRAKVLDAIDRLQSGGSTNGGAGIELAYKTAQQHFIKGGVNRVILCTDGDFNVGTTSTGDLERMVEDKAKSGVFLSVLGFGRGNLNDAMMETISNKGNGNYAYIDGITEAQKVLVQQMGGTLVTIAKDVKIQVEFNPTQVEAYRLIGYENRILAAEDFNDDKKDAGEIGAGHTVTALYELVPAGGKVELPDVDPLRYQAAPTENQNEQVADELLTLKLRYKQPDGDTSQLLEFPTTDADTSFSKATPDFQFAAAVASFGMLLRGSVHQGLSTYDAVLEIAESAKGPDKHGYRAEFIEIVKRAKPHAEKQAALIEEARKAMEAARESAQRAKPDEGIQGVVLAATDKGLVEISLGSDDGVLKGHKLDVYHTKDASSYVGRIEVVNTKPDKAVCKIHPKLKKGEIQVSDRVVARGAEE